MADTKIEYEVLEDGFIAGDYYKAGTTAHFEPSSVKFLVAPYGDRLKVKADTKPAKKAADKGSSEL